MYSKLAVAVRTILKGRVALALVTALATLLLIEFALRQSSLQAVLPFPTYYTDNPEFSIKVGRLDTLLRESGEPLNCLFMGSSAVDADGDIKAFTEAYRKDSGQIIRCYNFALPGLPPSSAGTVGRFLINRYHPQLLIYGIGAFEFSDDFVGREGNVYEATWIKYIGGQFSWGGWWIDHSSIIQHLSSVKYIVNYEYHNLYDAPEQGLDSEGYLAHPTAHFYKPTGTIKYPNFKLNQDGWAGFQDFLNLDHISETRLVIFEEPVEPAFLQTDYFEAGITTYEHEFLVPVQALLQSKQVPFVKNQVMPAIPGDGWTDATHLDSTGARVFSTWLGSQINLLIQQGVLQPLSR